MPALSDYSNVYASCFDLLASKGFQFWYERKRELFWAERDGWDFCADSPCGLLGLVALFEAQAPDKWHEDWWRRSTAPRAQDLADVPSRRYVPIFSRDRSG